MRVSLRLLGVGGLYTQPHEGWRSSVALCVVNDGHLHGLGGRVDYVGIQDGVESSILGALDG